MIIDKAISRIKFFTIKKVTGLSFFGKLLVFICASCSFILSVPSAGAFSPASIPLVSLSPYPFAPPVAAFSISDSSICTGSCVNFTDASLNAPTSWSWTFNGATPSSSAIQNPTNICYSSPGTYVATLVATNGSGSDTLRKNVIVSGPPAGNILRFQRHLGKSSADLQVRSISQTSDDGYILAGAIDNSGVQDPVLAKTDKTGNILWVKTYGGAGNNEYFYSVAQTSDNGYVANGFSDSFGAGNVDAYVVKTDATGSVQWSHTFGGAGLDDSYSGQQTTDGGYIIAGSYSVINSELFLVKMDSTGNQQWTKTVGGSGNDIAYSVQQTKDKGYVATGYTSSFGAGGNDVYLVKTDSTGTVQWTKTYGGSGDDEGRSVEQTKDGGYIIGGKTGSFPGGFSVYLIKTDSAGDTLWTRAYKGTYGYSVHQTTDGGYAIMGRYNIGFLNEDNYLLKVDSSGNLQWAKSYGGSSVDLGYCGTQTADGGYVVGGTWESSPLFGVNDIYLIKTDSAGNSGCNETAVIPANKFGAFIASGGTIATNGVQTNVTSVLTSIILKDSVFCIDSASIQTAYSMCNGGSVTLNAFGGNTYSWSPSTGLSNTNIPNPVANPTSTTTYTLTIFRGPCSITKNVTVFVLPLPVIAISGDTVICIGGFTTLSASGGKTYSWSTGAIADTIVVNPTATSAYTVTGTDSLGCSNSATATVTVASAIVASISGDTVICLGQTANLTASGGSTYSWSTGAGTKTISVNPSVTTTYTVIAISGSCADTASTTVNVSPPVTAFISNDTTICNGQSVTLTASGGPFFLWNTGDTTASISITPTSASNLYYVFVSNSACSDSAAVTVTAGLSAVDVSNDTSICSGQTITLSAAGGTTYSWSTGAATDSITINPPSTTTYTVVISDGSCADTATVQVAVALPLTATISKDTSICQGQNVLLTAGGGNQYSWSNGATVNSISVTPTTTTTYSVLVSNGGCFDTASVLINVNPTPVAVIFKDTTICRYQTVKLTASGGTSFLWNTGATTSSITVNPGITTTYSVIVSNGTCSATAKATATVNNVVGATISGDTTLCRGQSTILAATGGIYYYWINTMDTTQSIIVSPSVTTPYSVWVSNGTCIDTARVTVVVNPAPVAMAGTDTTIDIGESVMLNGSGGPSYNWSPATDLSCTACQNPIASPFGTTTYVLTITYGNGCTSTDMVTVFVDINCGDLFIPTAFSPNHDGQNEILFVKDNCIKTMTFIIYDRWGDKVFESDNIKKGWDGTYKGKPLNSAVFAYYLEATLVTGETVNKKGSIHLIK